MTSIRTMDKPRMLAHVCCAPDALYVIEVLQADYDVTGYFYNPNIFPPEEYQLRLEEARKVARMLNFELVEEEYDCGHWLKLTEKFKDEPEKGRRCDICYALRLERTARKARELGFDCFCTIMSLSPWKKAAVLNRIGRMFSHRHKVRYLESNFKKRDGFHKSVELSKEHGLYRQDYCGCLYSLRPENSPGEKTEEEKKEG